MSSERKVYRLDELCEFINGFAFKSSDYVEQSDRTWEVLRMGYIHRGGGFKEDSTPVFVQRAYGKELGKYLIRPNDIVIAMTDMKNNVAILGNTARIRDANRFVLNQRVGCIRVKRQDLVDPSYLYYYSNWQPHVDYLRARANSGVQVNLSTPAIRDSEIELPPLAEQVSIGKLLAGIDDCITLLRETNATLEAIAQALFKSWFVDFDPVRAKMAGRAPEGIDEATAALFPDALEETELGLVPKGWHLANVGESFILTMGQSPPGDTYNDTSDGLPFYQGRTDFGFRFPTQRVFCSAPTRIAEIGDTLVSVRAPVGDVNMAIERCCVGRGVASVRHPDGHRSFTFYALRGLGGRFKTFDSEGTVFGSINKKDFQTLPVVNPGFKVLETFEVVSHPIDQRIVENEEKLRVLVALRDTLLPRLISGQLRLPEAQLDDALA